MKTEKKPELVDVDFKCPISGSSTCPVNGGENCNLIDNGQCRLIHKKQIMDEEPEIQIKKDGVLSELVKAFFPYIMIGLCALVAAYFQLNFLPRKEAEATYVRKDTYAIQLKNIEDALTKVEASLKEYNGLLISIKSGQDTLTGQMRNMEQEIKRVSENKK